MASRAELDALSLAGLSLPTTGPCVVGVGAQGTIVYAARTSDGVDAVVRVDRSSMVSAPARREEEEEEGGREVKAPAWRATREELRTRNERVDGRNVVKLLGFARGRAIGEAPVFERSGPNLSVWTSLRLGCVANRRPATLDEVAHVLRGGLSGLAALRAAGLLRAETHANVNPRNLLLGGNGQWQIGDVGCALPCDGAPSWRAGHAPETAFGLGSADPGAQDVWALAACAFWLVDGEDLAALLLRFSHRAFDREIAAPERPPLLGEGQPDSALLARLSAVLLPHLRSGTRESAAVWPGSEDCVERMLWWRDRTLPSDSASDADQHRRFKTVLVYLQPALGGLLHKMLSIDPRRRPSPEQALLLLADKNAG